MRIERARCTVMDTGTSFCYERGSLRSLSTPRLLRFLVPMRMDIFRTAWTTLLNVIDCIYGMPLARTSVSQLSCSPATIFQVTIQCQQNSVRSILRGVYLSRYILYISDLTYLLRLKLFPLDLSDNIDAPLCPSCSFMGCLLSQSKQVNIALLLSMEAIRHFYEFVWTMPFDLTPRLLEQGLYDVLVCIQMYQLSGLFHCAGFGLQIATTESRRVVLKDPLHSKANEFIFDRVLDGGAEQAKVFEEVRIWFLFHTVLTCSQSPAHSKILSQ